MKRRASRQAKVRAIAVKLSARAENEEGKQQRAGTILCLSKPSFGPTELLELTVRDLTLKNTRGMWTTRNNYRTSLGSQCGITIINLRDVFLYLGLTGVCIYTFIYLLAT